MQGDWPHRHSITVSEANVEIVRRGYEAFNRGDLDAALEAFSPDAEWGVPDVLPDTGPYNGPEGVRRFWASWRETFEDFRVEIEEFIDAGDHVIAQASVRGRGRDSGVEVDTPSFPHVWTLRDGQVVKVEMLPNKALALERVGLVKPGDTGDSA